MTTNTPKTICSGIHDDPNVREVAEKYLLDGDKALQVADLFKAMSDPTRVRIIGLLAHAEMCVGDLCRVLGMSQPNVSHQLRLMRLSHLVTMRKEGRHILYTLADEHIHSVFHQILDHIQE